MNRLALCGLAQLALLIGFEAFFLRQKFLLRFWEVGVLNTAIDRTDCGALWLFVETDTLGTFIRNNVINVFRKWFIGFSEKRPGFAAFVDSGVWALWFASGAIDALLCDHQSHVDFPPKSLRLRVIRKTVWDYKKSFWSNSFVKCVLQS